MIKKLKNDTVSDITVNGQVITAGQYHTIEQHEELMWRDIADVEALIDATDLVFNDGTSDITDTTLAKKLLNSNSATAIGVKALSSSAPADTNLMQYDDTAKEVGWVASNSVGSGINSVQLFISDVDGENITTGAYSHVSFKPVKGPDAYNHASISFTFGSVGSTSNNDQLDVRLVVLSTGAVLGTLSWDNNINATLKTVTVTPPNGTNILEVQAKKTGGTGKLYSSGLEVVYG